MMQSDLRNSFAKRSKQAHEAAGGFSYKKRILVTGLILFRFRALFFPFAWLRQSPVAGHKTVGQNSHQTFSGRFDDAAAHYAACIASKPHTCGGLTAVCEAMDCGTVACETEEVRIKKSLPELAGSTEIFPDRETFT